MKAHIQFNSVFAIAFVMGCSGLANALDVTISQDFEGPGGAAYILTADATPMGGFVRLVPALTGQRGLLWFTDAVRVESFTASFDFRMGGGSGADGIGFFVADADTYDTTEIFGEPGPGSDSFVIEFDTYKNVGPELDDPNDNHVEVIIDGPPGDPDYFPSFNLDDGAWHSASISFDGANLSVVLDGSEVAFNSISAPWVIPRRVYFGLAASTGSTTNDHDIDNVTIQVVVPEPIPAASGWGMLVFTLCVCAYATHRLRHYSVRVI